MGGDAKKLDYRKTKKYRALRKSLLDRLKLRGLDNPAYVDKVEEYMDFWIRRCELRDDVAERGLVVIDERGRQTENRSISQEIQVSRQMLSIFTALGFKPDDLSGGAVDDDDAL